MDEVIYVEVLGQHGEVTARHATRSLPIRIGRAYDNDVILEDPYVAPHHVVVEQSPMGELELVDAGSRNGLFRVGTRHRIARESIDPAARYRAGRTELRIRPSSHPVAAELVDYGDSGRWQPVAAFVAVLAAAAMLLLSVWSATYERIELAKLALAPVVLVLSLLIWSGAWGLAGRLLIGERRFAVHLTAGALTVVGFFGAIQWDYFAFALSAPRFRYLAMPAIGAILAWGFWRHLCLVTRNPGRGVAVAAVGVAAAVIGSLALSFRADHAKELTEMSYLKAIKTPAVRLAKGRKTGEFFRDAERLRPELESLKEMER